MQSEQQQRIMGYFIEEAKDHLNTIEQGLLSLQSTMEDKAMREEVYRAAHSVKGGAGMLGVSSIHKTAHKLEDYFKYLEKALEESPVQVDPHLESLFLSVYDTLEALIEQLESPFGLTDEIANSIMSDAEPVFQEINTHIVELVNSCKTATVATTQSPKVAMKKAQPIPEKSTAQPMSFKRDVLIGLREMLELFKQQDSPENRQKLQENCTQLCNLGEELEIPGWSELLKTSKQAIAYQENSYRLLAGLVIKEIKEAQELIMVGRSLEIAPSVQLKALVPEISTSQEPQTYHITDSLTTETNLLSEPDTYIQKDIIEESHPQETGEWSIAYGEEFALEVNPSSRLSYSQEEETFNHPSSIYGQSRIGSGAATNFAEPSEPEVGIAELNSLADIFEGQTPDLDETWQEEEIIMLEDMDLASTPEQFFSLEDQSDFADLIDEEDSSEVPTAELSTNDDWMGLLGDEATEEISLDSQDSTDAIDALLSDEKPQPTLSKTTNSDSTFEDVLFADKSQESEFSDLIFDDTSEAFLVPPTDAGDLNILFGDSFLEEENSLEFDENLDDFIFDSATVTHLEDATEATSQLQSQDDDLFGLSTAGELNNGDAFIVATDEISNDLTSSNNLLENLDDSDSETQEFTLDGLIMGENVPVDSPDSLFLELDDLGSEESLQEEAQSSESLDFNDLLDISGSESLATKQNEPTPELLGFDELIFDDSVAGLAGESSEFDELIFDDSVAGLAGESSEDFDLNGLSSDHELNLSLDDDLFDVSLSSTNSSTDLSQESLFFTDELNGSQTPELELESDTEETLDSLDLDLDLEATPSLDLESDTEETLDSLDLDFAETTPSLELESDTEETLDSLDLDLDLEATPSLDLGSESEETLDSLDLDLDLETTPSLELESDTEETLDSLDLDFAETTASLDLESDTEETLDSLDLDFAETTPSLELELDTEDTLDSLDLDFAETTASLDLESDTEETLDSLDLDFAETTASLELDSESEETLDSLDLDFAETTASLDLESDTEETLDSLDLDFEEATPNNVLELEEETSPQIDYLLENQTISAVESLDIQGEDSLEDEGITLDYLDNFDELFVLPTAERNNLEIAENAENLDLFDNSLDLESNLELEGIETLEADNFDDFLSIAAEEDTEIQSPAISLPEASEWDFELEEEQTDATESQSIEQESPISLEAIALTSLGAGMLVSSLANKEHRDSKINQASTDEIATTSEIEDEWEGLDELLAEDNQVSFVAQEPLEQALTDDFADLEAMLATHETPVVAANQLANADLDMFGELESLLGDQSSETTKSPAAEKSAAPSKKSIDDEFKDMEKLLEQAEQTLGGPPKRQSPYPQQVSSVRNRPPIGSARKPDQTIRVPVKHMDNLGNLVGELVVNRNSLEQDQERLRQFLDNLSHQVIALSDVGARMQDLYERTLLENALLASRSYHRSSFGSESSSQNSNSSGPDYDPLEMDRFTGFHLLSQEMIELIVRVRESASDIEFLVDETDQVARMLRQVTTQLQEGLMRGRMVPFAHTTDRLPRAVREISLKLNKQAELQVDGRETLIDKLILEHLSDPLTHLVNNALTHGIETPEIRQAAGKPRAGRITLRAFHQGNQTVISISDDGAGIDPEVVRKKAIEKKLISPAQAKTLTPLDLYEFLFHPGFSTKDKADDFSGRGVGMDVVLTSLSEIRGTIHIDSALGKGTTFTIRLPLVLSICKALSCLSDKARIAFPMDGVEDTLDVSPAHVQINAEGKTCIQWRDTMLPFQPLAELLKYNRHLSRGNVYGGKREDDTISIVVLRSAGNFLAIQVDQVLGQQEIVIKQLEGPAPKPVGIAGATVLGDGRIMPIADVLELIELSRGRIRPDGEVRIWSRDDASDLIPAEAPVTKVEPLVLIVDDSITVRSLLEMTFNKAGYRVEQARDGQEAWDKLRSGLPCDIVFCDIEMPRMDGLELLSRLQKDEELCHLPIAMLTSRGSQRHQQMASELGARGYFIKPYLEEVLLDAAQRMIKGEVLLTSKSNA